MRLLEEAGAPDEAYPTVENLLPGTIQAVAVRTVRSHTFVDLVYRECEINALWSLADIGLSDARRFSRPRRAGDASDRAQLLAQLRALFEEAYRHLVREHTAKASETLARAATLSSDGRGR